MTKKVLFLPDGKTAVFDEQGQQMPELQRSWINIFANFLDDHDEDPAEFEFTLPDGTKLMLLESGWTVVW